MKKLLLWVAILGVGLFSANIAGADFGVPKLEPARGEVGEEVYILAPSGESFPEIAEGYWDDHVIDFIWFDEHTLIINVPDDAKVGRHGVQFGWGGRRSGEAIFTVLVPGSEDTPADDGSGGGGLPAENENPPADAEKGYFKDLKRFPGEELTFQDILKIFNNFTCWILQITNYLIIILLVYSAWLFFSAGDNVAKGQTARQNFRYVLIGILVVFAAGVIISSVARLAGVDITLVRCIF